MDKCIQCGKAIPDANPNDNTLCDECIELERNYADKIADDFQRRNDNK